MRFSTYARALAALSLLGLLLGASGVVWAQEEPAPAPQVSLSETSLPFRGQAGESLQRTVTLSASGGPVEQVTVVRHDLLDVGTGVVILSEQVAVDPETVASFEEAQRFTVTVKEGAQGGHYVGTLEFHYKGQPEDAPLVVTLDVTLDTNSQVDAGVSSKSPVIEAVPPWYSLPFGRPSASPDSPALGRVTISLVQAGEGPAELVDATVLALVGPRNQTLPDQAVTVASPLPLTIEGRGAANVEMVARGKGLNAGEYNGTLYLNVRNQAPVQVPLKILVKDGPLLPCLVLFVAPLVGLLIALWNRDGKKRYDLYRRLEGLEKELAGEPQLVQIDELDKARRDLEAIKNAMVNGDGVAAITTQVDALDAALTATKQEAQKLLDDELTPLESQLDGLKTGRAYRDLLAQDVRNSIDRLNEGNFQNMGHARNAATSAKSNYDDLKAAEERFKALSREDQHKIQEQVNKATTYEVIDRLIADMERVAAKVQAVPEAYQARVRSWVDEAATLRDAQKVVDRAQAVCVALEGLPEAERKKAEKDLEFATTLEQCEKAVSITPPSGQPEADGGIKVGALEGPPPVPREPAKPSRRAWERAGLKLRWRRFAVFGIVYLFTLMVGLITLYAATPTFGADPREYVTLFLWGVSATTVGAQTVSLQSIFDRTKQPEGGEG